MLGGLFKKKPPSLEQQLSDLAGCGVRLLPAATAAALLEQWSREDFERAPYVLAAAALGGDLPLREIRDHVDVLEQTAWLEFELDGEDYHWDCEVSDDWVDTEILSGFAELLEERETGRRFTYLDTGGQDCVIGCFRNIQRAHLCKVTGLDWQWLS